MRAPDRRPRFGEVAMEQFEVTAIVQRPLVLTWALVAAAVVIFMVVVSAPEFGAHGAASALLLLALVWPLVLWRHEPPARRGGLWAAPLPRAGHTLLRVGIGWACLVVVALVYLPLAGVAALAAGWLGRPAGQLLAYTAHLLLALTALYLLVTAVAIRFGNSRWVILAAAVWSIMAVGILATEGAGWPGDVARSFLRHLSVAMVPGSLHPPSVWLGALAPWLLAGLTLNAVAALLFHEPDPSP